MSKGEIVNTFSNSHSFNQLNNFIVRKIDHDGIVGGPTGVFGGIYCEDVSCHKGAVSAASRRVTD